MPRACQAEEHEVRCPAVPSSFQHLMRQPLSPKNQDGGRPKASDKDAPDQLTPAGSLGKGVSVKQNHTVSTHDIHSHLTAYAN